MCFYPISKSPQNSHTKKIVICWFDDILFILIHGFDVFQVDLAFPHHFYPQNSPNFHLKFSFVHETLEFITNRFSPLAGHPIRDRSSDSHRSFDHYRTSNQNLTKLNLSQKITATAHTSALPPSFDQFVSNFDRISTTSSTYYQRFPQPPWLIRYLRQF